MLLISLLDNLVVDIDLAILHAVLLKNLFIILVEPEDTMEFFSGYQTVSTSYTRCKSNDLTSHGFNSELNDFLLYIQENFFEQTDMASVFINVMHPSVTLFDIILIVVRQDFFVENVVLLKLFRNSGNLFFFLALSLNSFPDLHKLRNHLALEFKKLSDDLKD